MDGIRIRLIVAVLATASIVGWLAALAGTSSVILTGLLTFVFSVIFLTAFAVAYRVVDVLRPVILVPLLYIGYYSLGSLNISNYRGTIKPVFYLVAGLGLAGYLFGVLAADVTLRVARSRTVVPSANLERLTTGRGAALAWLAILVGLGIVGVIYALYGVPILHPFSRFAVRPALLKASSILWLGAVLLVARELGMRARPRLVVWLLVAFVGVVVLTLGFRTYAVIFGMVLVGLLYYRSRPSARVVALTAAMVLVFSAGFWGLRFSSGENRGTNLTNVFDAYGLPQGMNPLFAVAYLQTREAAGITQQIIDRSDAQGFLEGQLLISDFLTVLPRDKAEKITGGFMVISYLNAQASAGWAPSILGGLFLDFGMYGVIVGLALVGFILERAYLTYIRRQDAISLVSYVYLLVAAVNYMHRGVLLPDYVYHYVVLVGVVWLSTRRSALRVGAPAGRRVLAVDMAAA